MALVHKAYKFLALPNPKQIVQITETFNCKRFVYNKFIEINENRLSLGEYKLEYEKASKVLTLLKQKHPWLSKGDKFSMQNALKDLDVAYDKLFSKKGGRPNFKSRKHSQQSYKTNLTNNNIELRGSFIKLPKLGLLKFKKSQEILGKIISVNVSYKNFKYFISITTESEPKSMPTTNSRVGIDLGLKSLTYLKYDDGRSEDIKNPKWLEKNLVLLKKRQKQLSKKQHTRFKGDQTKKSKRYLKKQKQVSKIHTKTANQRKDFLHKLTTKIIRENQAIGIEDLAVSNLMKNHKLSRHIAQSGWAMFRDFLEYKSKWYGRELVIHNRFFASSKTCRCKVVNHNLTLKDRTWRCESCGCLNHRDELAAQNLIPMIIPHQIPVEDGEYTLVEYALSGSEAI